MPINSFTCRTSWSCHHVAKENIMIWYKVSSWVSCNQATPTSTQKPHHEPFPPAQAPGVECPSTSCSWRRFLNKQASLSHQLSKASSTAPFCSVAGRCMKSVKAGEFWGVNRPAVLFPESDRDDPLRWCHAINYESKTFEGQYQWLKWKLYAEVGRINHIIKNKET